MAPAGRLVLGTDSVIRDEGLPDPTVFDAVQHGVQDLPADTLLFLLPSRYCETDSLSAEAWRLFGHAPAGWGRVQAICDVVHRHIKFGYELPGPPARRRRPMPGGGVSAATMPIWL